VEADIWNRLPMDSDQQSHFAQVEDMTLAKSIVPSLEKASFSKTRKRVLVPAYVALIEEKKIKLGAKWQLQSDLTSLKQCMGQLESVGNAETDTQLATCWTVLEDLVKSMNAIDVSGVAGVNMVPMTNSQVEQVITEWKSAQAKALIVLDKLSKADGEEIVVREFTRYVVPSGPFKTDKVDIDSLMEMKQAQANIVRIRAHINSLAINNVGADAYGYLAHGSIGAQNSGLGKSSRIMFGASWLASSAEKRVATLVHEASHGVEAFGTIKLDGARDISYIGSWSHNIIKGAPAIYNAPSYESAVLRALGETDVRMPLPSVSINGQKQADSPYAAQLETLLGKLDFHLTQAWWFANNIAHFADSCATGKTALDTEGVEATEFFAKGSPNYKGFGVPVAKLIGLPMTVQEGGKTWFTGMDVQLHHLLVRHIARFKNTVNAINSLSIKDSVSDVLDGSTVTLTPSDAEKLDDNMDFVMEKILQAAAVKVHFPSSFYASSNTITALVKKLSGYKDTVESNVPKDGLKG
jgi:hypothetical protein